MENKKKEEILFLGSTMYTNEKNQLNFDMRNVDKIDVARGITFIHSVT